MTVVGRISRSAMIEEGMMAEQDARGDVEKCLEDEGDRNAIAPR